MSVAKWNLEFTKFESRPVQGAQMYVLYVTAVFIEGIIPVNRYVCVCARACAPVCSHYFSSLHDSSSNWRLLLCITQTAV